MKQMSVSTRPRRAAHNYSLDRVFSWIVEYKKIHDGNSPTIREIMDAFDISTTSVAHSILKRLEYAGRIRRSTSGSRIASRSRCIEVIGGQWTLIAAK